MYSSPGLVICLHVPPLSNPFLPSLLFLLIPPHAPPPSSPQIHQPLCSETPGGLKPG